MHSLNGSCHCGNLSVALQLTQAPAEYAPRRCDCDFCRKHGASYLADPAGTLRIEVKNPSTLSKYRQGSSTADCLVCGTCGVLVAITMECGGQCYGVVNVSVIDGDVGFGESKIVSPRALSAEEKVARWKQLWFARVDFK